MNNTAPKLKLASELKVRPLINYIDEPGLQLYCVTDSSLPICKIEFFFPAGTIYERNNLESMFTATMLDEGTNTLNMDQISEYLESFGASLEKENAERYAILRLYCLSKHAKELVRFINELLLEVSFPEDRLDYKRKQYIESHRLNNNKVSVVAYRNFKNDFFGSESRLGYLVSEQDYENINKDSLIDFYNDRYKNSRLLIIASGDINTTLVEELSKFRLNSIQDDKINSDESIDIKIVSNGLHRQVEMKNKVVQSAIVSGLPWVSRHHEDFIVASVLNIILGGYFGSRLMHVIREQKGYTYGIHSVIKTIGSIAYLTIQTEVGKNYTEDTIQEIKDQIDLLSKGPVTEDELQRAKNYMAGLYLSQTDTAFKTSRLYNVMIIDKLIHQTIEDQYIKLLKVSINDVQMVASKYLSSELLTTISAG